MKNNIDEKIKEVESQMIDKSLAENTASVSSRISGYYRDIDNWNEGKTSEYQQRTEYEI